MWGFNYYREPIATKFEIEETKEYQELVDFTRQLIKKTNIAQPYIFSVSYCYGIETINNYFTQNNPMSSKCGFLNQIKNNYCQTKHAQICNKQKWYPTFDFIF